MRKASVSTTKVHKVWKELRKDKRSMYNPKYTKWGKRGHTLATSIKFIETGHGGDMEVTFVDDVTEEEVERVVEIMRSTL